MSKGNPNKRKGTAFERKVLYELREADPDGGWESRTQDVHGHKRQHQPTHGFDVWSEKRAIYIECKARKGHVTQHVLEEWLQQHHAFSTTIPVVVFKSGRDVWAAVAHECRKTYHIEPWWVFLEQFWED